MPVSGNQSTLDHASPFGPWKLSKWLAGVVGNLRNNSSWVLSVGHEAERRSRCGMGVEHAGCVVQVAELFINETKGEIVQWLSAKQLSGISFLI